MSLDPTSKFRVPKDRADAVLTLSSGASMRGCVFLAGGSARHTGPERVGELLNAETGFFPFEVQDAGSVRTVLVNRRHVVMVALADNEASRDPGYDVARRQPASVLMSSGQRVVGAVRVYQPEGPRSAQRLGPSARGLPLCRNRRRDVHRQHGARRRGERGPRRMSEGPPIDRLFHAMCAAGASDLHLCVGSTPLVRKDGRMQPLDAAAPALTAPEIVQLLAPIMPERNRAGVRRAARHRLRLRDSRPGAVPLQRLRRSQGSRRRVPRHPRRPSSPPSSSACRRTSCSCAS